MKKQNTLFFALLLCNALLQAHKEENHYATIAPLHLSSYPAEIIEKKTTKPESKTLFERTTGIKPPTYKNEQLSDRERLSRLYNIFESADFKSNNIITMHGLRELELLAGNTTKETSLLSCIDRTVTPEGKIYLAGLITNPTTDIQTLKDRQEIIRFFIEKQDIIKAFDALFLNIKSQHDTCLSLWKEENQGEKLFIDNAFWSMPGLKKLNTNTPWQYVSSAWNCLFMPAICATVDTKIIKITYQNFDMVKAVVPILYKESPARTIFSATLLSAYLGFIHYMAYSTTMQYIQLLNYLHEKTNSVAVVIKALDAAEKIIKKSPELQTLQHKQVIFNFAQSTDALSGKMKKLLGLLRTSTFEGPVKTLSLKGRVKAAYALLQEVKDELAPALIALAEFDAYIGLAKLYTEYKDKTNHFVFANYITQNTPSVVMQNMWHPFVGSESAIANSIALGTTTPNNVILTGPNAGGKSTFIKGLTLNIILAQTIGMVPASSFALTPFAKINTYMNIADDTSGGNSLFKAEVLRAQELIQNIDALQSGEFAFSVMDEIFSGTSPKEGEAASYAVAHELGSRKNSMLMLATHFPKLKELEKITGNFKNYQVRVIRHDNGTFSYPFKLEFGAADQNVAIEILQQQGFSSSILNTAHQILGK